jgi:hypothetical protein
LFFFVPLIFTRTIQAKLKDGNASARGTRRKQEGSSHDCVLSVMAKNGTIYAKILALIAVYVMRDVKPYPIYHMFCLKY